MSPAVKESPLRLVHPTVESAQAQASLDDDDALLQRAAVGDGTAFSELVRRHQANLLRVLRRYAPDEAAAHDLAQRAFLRALESSRRPVLGLLGKRAPFGPWLFR